MKRALLRIALTSALAVITTLSHAGGYMGVGYTMIDTGGKDHTGYQLSAGYQINEIVGLEARTLLGASTEQIDGVSIDIDQFSGGYLTLQLPMGDEVSPYVIVGRSYGKVSAEYQGNTATASEKSTSYGLGLRVNVRESFTIQTEYMRAFDDVKALTLTARLNF